MKVGKTFVVLGMQYGNEGKGKLVDFLSSRNESIHAFRYNEGSTSSHEISIKKKIYYTNIIPSGAMTQGSKNYIGPGVAVNIEDLFEEIDYLARKNINLSKRLFISEKSILVLKKHKILDEGNEPKLKGKGKGVTAAYEDMALRMALRFEDNLGDKVVEKITKAYEFFNNSNKDEYMLQDIRSIENNIARLRPMIICHEDIQKVFDDPSNNIIIEGAGGVMKDIKIGGYPNVVNSNCLFSGVFTSLGISYTSLKTRNWETIGVVKAYATDDAQIGPATYIHGPCSYGELPSDEYMDFLAFGGEHRNELGQYPGFGWLDLVQIKYAQMLNRVDYLNLTKLDVLSYLDCIKVCTSYENNKHFTPYPRIEEVKYKSFQNWKYQKIGGISQYNDLPKAVKDYIEFIEDYVGVPVKYINTDKDRDEMIVRSDEEMKEVKERIKLRSVKNE